MTEQSEVTVILFDPNLVMRRGLRTLLESCDRIMVADEAATGGEAAERTQRLRPDVVLVSVRSPQPEDYAALEQLRGLTGVLLLSDTEDRAMVERALRSGVTGHLVHGQFDDEELIDAVVASAGHRGRFSPGVIEAMVESVRSTSTSPGTLDRRKPVDDRFGLSPREVEIMESIVWGHGNRDIAQTLFISEKTVKNHINRIYMKLGCRTRSEAIAQWLGIARPVPAGRRPAVASR